MPMHSAAVLNIDYDRIGKSLHIQTTGHVTDCIDLSRELGRLMLGAQPWLLTSIVGKMPKDYKHPSEMVVDIFINGG